MNYFCGDQLRWSNHQRLFFGDLTSYINSVNVQKLMYIRWSPQKLEKTTTLVTSRKTTIHFCTSPDYNLSLYRLYNLVTSFFSKTNHLLQPLETPGCNSLCKMHMVTWCKITCTMKDCNQVMYKSCWWLWWSTLLISPMISNQKRNWSNKSVQWKIGLWPSVMTLWPPFFTSSMYN